jgi:hypothetical protein
MPELDGTLSDLARLRGGSEPIVSLYADVRWKDEQQRHRVRLFVQEEIRRILKHYLPESPGRDGLERTLRKIEAYVAGLTSQAFEAERRGLALFACESLNLWRPLFFGRHFENELAADAVPHLTKLARLSEDVAPAIVAVPRQDGADVYQVRFGDLEVENGIRGFVPRSDVDVFNPGAAKHGRYYEREKKEERRQEAYVERNRRAAAAELTALFDQLRGSKLILVGPAETVAAFERELPERVREQVIARVPRPREWDSGDGIRRSGVKALAEAVLTHEREEEARVVDAVVGQALRGALAVLGPDDVVLALNERRVHTLVLEADFDRTGWRCDNCSALGQNAETRETCPFCAGDLRVVHHLGEAIVARALTDGARVEIVPHGNKLHSYRGVAAFLRQTAPTGLRGSSQPWPTAPGASRA